MLYSEIISVCSHIHTKHINTLCGQRVQLLNVKPVDASRNRSAVLYQDYTCQSHSWQINSQYLSLRINSLPCTRRIRCRTHGPCPEYQAWRSDTRIMRH